MAQGIHNQYKYKGQTQELQGISFRIGEDRFKGSQIDRQFSLGNLLKTLAAQRKRQEVKPALSLEERKKALLIRAKSRQSPPPAPTPKQVLSPLILELLKPVETEGGVPYELTDAYRRNKKKRKGPSL
jgi:hypothetical protein